MTPEQLYELGMKEAENFTDTQLRKFADYPDAFDPKIYNYKFLPALVKALELPQVVELGGAMGVMTAAMAAYMGPKTHFWTITLPEGGLEFSMCGDYPNVTKVVGDDLKWHSWPPEFDISKTDLLYIDSEHTYEQLTMELEMYGPKLKTGCIVCFDDIHLHAGMNRAWEEVKWPKYSTPRDTDKVLHWSGWGIAVVD
jgi:hypothetical protein